MAEALLWLVAAVTNLSFFQRLLAQFSCRHKSNSVGCSGLEVLNDNQQKKGKHMSLRLGDIAPNFSATTTEDTIDFYQWLGNSWGVLFSHPADYTPVCTTELGAVAKLKAEFDKRNVKAIAVSVDPLDSHHGWIKDINETQACTMNFPIIADENRQVASAYDMIHPNADDKATVRSVFIIGPDKKIKLTLTYPASTGRNFAEILRVIDSLQLTASTKWPRRLTGGEARTASCRLRFPTATPRNFFPKEFAK